MFKPKLSMCDSDELAFRLSGIFHQSCWQSPDLFLAARQNDSPRCFLYFRGCLSNCRLSALKQTKLADYPLNCVCVVWSVFDECYFSARLAVRLDDDRQLMGQHVCSKLSKNRKEFDARINSRLPVLATMALLQEPSFVAPCEPSAYNYSAKGTKYACNAYDSIYGVHK
jgi:hypothetical protein